METNISNLSNYPSNGSLDSQLRSFQSQRTQVASVSTSKSIDVDLVTKEGDKVTISLDAKTAAMYGSYEKNELNEDGFSSQKTELSVSLYEREMTFTVEGDLNADEKKDIKKALKTLDRMMNNLMNGNLKPMQAKAEKLRGLDTIAGLEAEMSYQRETIVASQTQIEVVTGPAQVQVPITDPGEASLTAPDEIQTEQVDAVADAMAKEVESTRTRHDRMMAFVDQLLNDYRQRMGKKHHRGSKMVDRISDGIRDALSEFNKFKNNDQKLVA